MSWFLIDGKSEFPAIEDDYNGPKLEDGKVTLTFMKELMQHYKAQKKLHKKFAYKVRPLKYIIAF